MKISKRLSIWCSRELQLENVIQQTVEYGFSLMFDTLLKYAIIFFSGIICKKVSNTVLVLIIFALLRSSAGGYHAKTSLGCGLYMFFIWAISIFLPNIYSHKPMIILAIYFFCIVTICCFAPNGGPNNLPSNKVQIIYFKKLFAIATVTICSLIAYKIPYFQSNILTVMISTMFLIIKEALGKGVHYETETTNS